MKNNLKVKVSLFTLILAFMAIGTFAIAKEVMKKEQPVEVVKVLNTDTWYFMGSSTDNPADPELYSQTPPEDGCPTPIEKICEIKAPANSLGQPDMGATVGTGPETVQDQIEEAHNSLVDPNSPGPQLNSTVTAFRSN